MEGLQGKAIGERLVKDDRIAAVFEKYEIDNYCNGNRFVAKTYQHDDAEV